MNVKIKDHALGIPEQIKTKGITFEVWNTIRYGDLTIRQSGVTWGKTTKKTLTWAGFARRMASA